MSGPRPRRFWWRPKAGDPDRLASPLTRRQRRERWFKRLIVGLTVASVAAILAALPASRLALQGLLRAGRERTRAIAGLPFDPTVDRPGRERERALAIRLTRPPYRAQVAGLPGAFQEFLELAGMGPDQALIAWGGTDSVFAFSAEVFEADAAGRSYRLRPGVRSVWVRGLSLSTVAAMFLVPDRPEVRAAAAATGGRVVPDALQTTNAWGCRGPEPALDAPVRVLVLGDSMMQGVLVGDADTGPAQLERRLAEELGTKVAVLNCGVMGYALEQYFFTLVAHGERFAPHCVVVALCHNDFGDFASPRDAAEAAYWLERIQQYCRSHGWLDLLVPLPIEEHLLGVREVADFPGIVTRSTRVGGAHFFDPVEPMTDADLRLRVEAEARGRPVTFSPLFNRDRGDRHFSARGNAVWAAALARRVALLLRYLPERAGGVVLPAAAN